MEQQNNYSESLLQKAKNPIPTQEIKIEGIGSAKLYGTLDAEAIIKRLLDSKAITG